MGSRGQRSASSKTVDMADGGARSNAPWDKSHPAIKEPLSVSEALGKRGRPMGLDRALACANPYFTGDHREFSENCQRAVVAYEMRRRGYKVTAQPTFEGDALPSVVKGNGIWQGAFKGAKRESIAAATTVKARARLEAKMKGYGAGSRAVVVVQWKSGGGHAFNVENSGGRISYVDAQTGDRYNPKTILNGTKPGSVGIVRTDKLRVSARASKSVWTRGA